MFHYNRSIYTNSIRRQMQKKLHLILFETRIEKVKFVKLIPTYSLLTQIDIVQMNTSFANILVGLAIYFCANKYLNNR